MKGSVPRAAVAEAILQLVTARGSAKSICPTEAARVLAGADEDWRRHLPTVRAVAAELAREGRLVILRHGKPIDPDAMRGVIRLALPHEPPPDPTPAED